MTALTPVAPPDLRRDENLALASTYIDLTEHLGTVSDRHYQQHFEYDPDGTDDAFRAYLDERAQLRDDLKRCAACADASYQALCEALSALPEGQWTLQGIVAEKRVTVVYEPVVRAVMATRVEV